MKKYQVNIKAVISKDIIVEAVNEQEAEKIAHEIFSVLCDNPDKETYDQHCDGIQELTE